MEQFYILDNDAYLPALWIDNQGSVAWILQNMENIFLFNVIILAIYKRKTEIPQIPFISVQFF